MATSTINNDGFEWAATGSFPGTWADVSDVGSNTNLAFPDSICVGAWYDSPYEVQSYYHAAMTFGNLVGFNAGLVTNADLVLRFEKAHKTCTFRIKAVLPDTPVMGQSNLPSAQTLTTAYVEVVMSTLVGYDQFGYWNPPATTLDISAVVQEFIDHANYASGDDLTLVYEYQGLSPASDSLTGLSGDAAGTPTSFSYTITDNINPSITSVSGNNDIVNGETMQVLVEDLNNVTNHRIYKGSQYQSLTATPITGGFDIVFNAVSLGFGSGYTYAIDADEGTFTQAVSISPEAGYSYVTVASPSIADNSLFFGAVPTVIDGDQVKFQLTTAVNGDTVSISATGVPSLAGPGTGIDTFLISFFDSTTKVWQSDETVTFDDIGYFIANKIGPMNLDYKLLGPIQSIDGVEVPTANMTLSIGSATANYVENPESQEGFNSVNKPSLKIIDGAGDLILYANRDNTGEFQFLESGVAVDLNLCTRIELKIGNSTFADSDYKWSDKFTKSESAGHLEVQLGELGLPPGKYKFYFVLYTAKHKYGIVWNEKDNYTLTLKDA